MNGGSRLKGVNSLKSSEDLRGLVRWHSRLDPFSYSEPLTNLASYFGAHGISDEMSLVESSSCANPNLISSEHACAKPMQRGLGVFTFPGMRDGRAVALHSPVLTLYGPECGLSLGPACALLDRATWECPPSRGDA
ncbi:hypothetical protein CRG98_021366 [Punica granatum]|uniref:Uncharacterized protein n=1 Tax=Punica granatum TaxID=22663 RepID=A0A2I0JPR3_PUNGR|nr:hypothetical protein CRG98_021366 [Punica granatum]